MKKPRIVIHIDGGLIQGVVSDQGGIDFKVIDHDLDGAAEEETQEIGREEVLITQYDRAKKNTAHVREVFSAKSNFLTEKAETINKTKSSKGA